MSRINLNIVATGDFARVNAQLDQLRRTVTQINAQGIGTGLSMQQIENINRAAKSYDTLLHSTGAFSRQMISVQDQTARFGKELEAGKLKLGQYFSVWREGSRSTSSQLRELARQQVALQQSIIRTDTMKPGRAFVDTPRLMEESATKAMVARKQLELYNLALYKGGDAMINWGKNTQWAGRQLMVGLTIPMVMLGKRASDAFKEFDQQMTRMIKVYGDGVTAATNSQIEAIRGQVTALAQDIAGKWGVAMKETAAISAELAATGMTGVKLLGAIEETTRLATLGEMDRQEAMKATIALQTTFGLSTKELSGAVDFLNATENATSTSLQDLVEAIPRAGTVVKQLGGDYKELTVMMVAMREAGVSSGEAANAIKSTLASLINPTAKISDHFKQFGISLGKIRDQAGGDPVKMFGSLATELNKLDKITRARLIEELFGKYQFARVSSLIDNLGRKGSQTQKVFELMGKSAKALAANSDKEMKTMMESPSKRYEKALEKFNAAIMPIGEKFLNFATGALNFFSKIFEFVDSHPGLKNFLTSIGSIVALAGPVIMLTGVFGNFFGYLLKGFATFKNFRNGFKGFGEIVTAESVAAAKSGDLFQASLIRQSEAAQILEQAITSLNAELATYRGNISGLPPTPMGGGRPSGGGPTGGGPRPNNPTPTAPSGAPASVRATPQIAPIIRTSGPILATIPEGVMSQWLPSTGEDGKTGRKGTEILHTTARSVLEEELLRDPEILARAEATGRTPRNIASEAVTRGAWSVRGLPTREVAGAGSAIQRAIGDVPQHFAMPSEEMLRSMGVSLSPEEKRSIMTGTLTGWAAQDGPGTKPYARQLTQSIVSGTHPRYKLSDAELETWVGSEARTTQAARAYVDSTMVEAERLLTTHEGQIDKNLVKLYKGATEAAGTGDWPTTQRSVDALMGHMKDNHAIVVPTLTQRIEQIDDMYMRSFQTAMNSPEFSGMSDVQRVAGAAAIAQTQVDEALDREGMQTAKRFAEYEADLEKAKSKLGIQTRYSRLGMGEIVSAGASKAVAEAQNLKLAEDQAEQAARQSLERTRADMQEAANAQRAAAATVNAGGVGGYGMPIPGMPVIPAAGGKRPPRVTVPRRAGGDSVQVNPNGYITGPGTGTSDSIPALLQNGSFVVKASSTAAIGKNQLDSMNIGGYQVGGYVPAYISNSEYVFGPKAVNAIGIDNLRYMNETGSMPNFNMGGYVPRFMLGGAAARFFQRRMMAEEVARLARMPSRPGLQGHPLADPETFKTWKLLDSRALPPGVQRPISQEEYLKMYDNPETRPLLIKKIQEMQELSGEESITHISSISRKWGLPQLLPEATYILPKDPILASIQATKIKTQYLKDGLRPRVITAEGREISSFDELLELDMLRSTRPWLTQWATNPKYKDVTLDDNFKKLDTEGFPSWRKGGYLRRMLGGPVYGSGGLPHFEKGGSSDFSMGLHNIPYDVDKSRVITDPFDPRWGSPGFKPEVIYEIVRNAGSAPIIDIGERKVVVVDVGGKKVPFYQSTGYGGKKEVAEGKWYPFFGIGEEGWFNKTHGKEMAEYYGSDELRQISEALDAKIGDIRHRTDIPKAAATRKGTTSHYDFINEAFPHVPATSSDVTDIEHERIRKNIDYIKEIAKGPWRYAPRRSTGGAIYGPGGSMDDRIPVRLSNGEYVVSAKGHRSVGTGFLDAINHGQFTMGYAAGGAVRPSRDGLVSPRYTHYAQRTYPGQELWRGQHSATGREADAARSVSATLASEPVQTLRALDRVKNGFRSFGTDIKETGSMWRRNITAMGFNSLNVSDQMKFAANGASQFSERMKEGAAKITGGLRIMRGIDVPVGGPLSEKSSIYQRRLLRAGMPRPGEGSWLMGGPSPYQLDHERKMKEAEDAAKRQERNARRKEFLKKGFKPGGMGMMTTSMGLMGAGGFGMTSENETVQGLSSVAMFAGMGAMAGPYGMAAGAAAGGVKMLFDQYQKSLDNLTKSVGEYAQAFGDLTVAEQDFLGTDLINLDQWNVDQLNEKTDEAKSAVEQFTEALKSAAQGTTEYATRQIFLQAQTAQDVLNDPRFQARLLEVKQAESLSGKSIEDQNIAIAGYVEAYARSAGRPEWVNELVNAVVPSKKEGPNVAKDAVSAYINSQKNSLDAYIKTVSTYGTSQKDFNTATTMLSEAQKNFSSFLGANPNLTYKSADTTITDAVQLLTDPNAINALAGIASGKGPGAYSQKIGDREITQAEAKRIIEPFLKPLGLLASDVARVGYVDEVSGTRMLRQAEGGGGGYLDELYGKLGINLKDSSPGNIAKINELSAISGLQNTMSETIGKQFATSAKMGDPQQFIDFLDDLQTEIIASSGEFGHLSFAAKSAAEGGLRDIRNSWNDLGDDFKSERDTFDAVLSALGQDINTAGLTDLAIAAKAAQLKLTDLGYSVQELQTMSDIQINVLVNRVVRTQQIQRGQEAMMNPMRQSLQQGLDYLAENQPAQDTGGGGGGGSSGGGSSEPSFDSKPYDDAIKAQQALIDNINKEREARQKLAEAQQANDEYLKNELAIRKKIADAQGAGDFLAADLAQRELNQLQDEKAKADAERAKRAEEDKRIAAAEKEIKRLQEALQAAQESAYGGGAGGGGGGTSGGGGGGTAQSQYALPQGVTAQSIEGIARAAIVDRGLKSLEQVLNDPVVKEQYNHVLAAFGGNKEAADSFFQGILDGINSNIATKIPEVQTALDEIGKALENSGQYISLPTGMKDTLQAKLADILGDPSKPIKKKREEMIAALKSFGIVDPAVIKSITKNITTSLGKSISNVSGKGWQQRLINKWSTAVGGVKFENLSPKDKKVVSVLLDSLAANGELSKEQMELLESKLFPFSNWPSAASGAGAGGGQIPSAAFSSATSKFNGGLETLIANGTNYAEQLSKDNPIDMKAAMTKIFVPGGTVQFNAQGDPSWVENGSTGREIPIGPVTKAAYGGYISGPGGPRDDLIPARLSDGEYVVQADAVDYYGKTFLDKVNQKRYGGENLKFAEGGRVGWESGMVSPSIFRYSRANPNGGGGSTNASDGPGVNGDSADVGSNNVTGGIRNGMQLVQWAIDKFVGKGIPYSKDYNDEQHGFGCSGFMTRILSQVGVHQEAYSPTQKNNTSPVPYEKSFPGDLIFWYFPSNQAWLQRAPGEPNHVGMIAGGGRMLHSSGGSGPNVTSLSGNYDPSGGHFLGVGKALPDSMRAAILPNYTPKWGMSNGMTEFPTQYTFHKGGMVGYAKGKEVMAMVQGGEVVIPTKTVDKVNPLLDALTNGTMGMGEITNNITINGANQSPEQIAKVVVKEIERSMKRTVSVRKVI